MTRARTLAALLGLAAAASLLAGCVPADPAPATTTSVATPTPTPTPTADTTTAPTSEAGAISSAEATFAAYIRTLDQIVIDGSTDVEQLKQYADGAAYANVVTGLQQVVQEKRTQTGYATFEETGSSIAPDQSGVQYGAVELVGCFDTSARDQRLADGSPAPVPALQRSVRNVSVAYDPTQGRWLVTFFGKPPAGDVAC